MPLIRANLYAWKYYFCFGDRLSNKGCSFSIRAFSAAVGGVLLSPDEEKSLTAS
jgi:hypothetical protein